MRAYLHGSSRESASLGLNPKEGVYNTGTVYLGNKERHGDGPVYPMLEQEYISVAKAAFCVCINLVHCPSSLSHIFITQTFFIMHNILSLTVLSIFLKVGACYTLPDTLLGDHASHPRSIISTRSSSNSSDCTFDFFDQQIDHFGQYNGTFKQRYNIITEFFKPGGPIFFFQGEESTELDCVNSTVYSSWVKELNGIAVILEHRYFGESAPFGVTDPTDPAQLPKFDYLTLDNVMADGAYFVEYLKKNISGAEDSKAIVASGSYGGFLATVFRQNHPEAFYGAIASAPPIEALSNKTTDTDRFNWGIWLNNVYQDKSYKASQNIKNAFAALADRFATNNTDGLREELSLCTQPTSLYDLSLINAIISNIYSDSAEFNYPISRPGRSSIAAPLEKVIDFALTQNDPIQILNETLSMWYGPPPGLDLPCIDWANPSFALAAVPLIQSPIFTYLTCKYFPLFGAGDMPNGTIFPATDSGQFGIEACDTVYNLSTPLAEELRTKYRYTPADLRNSTRIIWSLGQYDPTSGFSPTQPGINAPVLTADRNVSRILYTTGMAHREDLFAPDPSDKETVVEARNIELESIKGWLGFD
ncbi:uncharacterized protein LY89DRAFT_337845 [Mollisia scopiformis]|uniref:Uncharacterized protein n=1 Tax=Mollisia scopiformis TaxID=149040 RepID=A0A132B882_MOLSC|nr:uncharacterized protein LY89DRAFT_337845 [Mollisia scopiformis]KUJ08199.1 hypothetical protein LY89DRAFT_337845 [Mollisia scopiformis]